MIPFFIYYSMFGFQRVGDLIWAAGDMRCRGFLLGGTAGRTTLAGEGLQHQDGHSHLLACRSQPDVLRPGLRLRTRRHHPGRHPRMYETRKHLLLPDRGQRELPMPPMPEGVREGILKGMYLTSAEKIVTEGRQARVQLLGSGAILNEVVKAQEILAEKYDVAADVWSRHQLQGTAPRRHGVRPLEPAQSRREAAGAVRHADAGRHRRAGGGGVGLREDAA
jgi:pyruvate dehydrogenase E1 component